jgi:hypothetical protein
MDGFGSVYDGEENRVERERLSEFWGTSGECFRGIRDDRC